MPPKSSRLVDSVAAQWMDFDCFSKWAKTVLPSVGEEAVRGFWEDLYKETSFPAVVRVVMPDSDESSLSDYEEDRARRYGRTEVFCNVNARLGCVVVGSHVLTSV